MLVDWNGSDLKDKSIYEPLSDQVVYFITAFRSIIIVAIAVMPLVRLSANYSLLSSSYKFALGIF